MQDADENLRAEGISESHCFVGNIMIDSLNSCWTRANAQHSRRVGVDDSACGFDPASPSNVDDRET